MKDVRRYLNREEGGFVGKETKDLRISLARFIVRNFLVDFLENEKEAEKRLAKLKKKNLLKIGFYILKII